MRRLYPHRDAGHAHAIIPYFKFLGARPLNLRIQREKRVLRPSRKPMACFAIPICDIAMARPQLCFARKDCKARSCFSQLLVDVWIRGAFRAYK